jgi:hypothetical protein
MQLLQIGLEELSQLCERNQIDAVIQVDMVKSILSTSHTFEQVRFAGFLA